MESGNCVTETRELFGQVLVVSGKSKEKMVLYGVISPVKSKIFVLFLQMTNKLVIKRVFSFSVEKKQFYWNSPFLQPGIQL